MCLLSLLTADLTFLSLPVFLSGGLPIQVIPCEFSKIICILKSVIHSGDVRLVLRSLKYRVMSFRTQIKIV